MTGSEGVALASEEAVEVADAESEVLVMLELELAPVG